MGRINIKILKLKALKRKGEIKASNFFIYLIICLFVVFVYSNTIFASVVLNEVAIQPNQTVELYNTASTSADISSWYIDDAGGTTYYTIPSQTILPPQSCYLFSADFNFNKSSADIVRLFDNTSPPTSSSAKLIEQYSYAKAPEANYSFSKKTDGGFEWQTITSSLGLFNESLLSCIPTATPTPLPSATPSPTPTILPSPTTEPTQAPSHTPEIHYQNIFISEVYPYPPSGEHEWVEIYNGNNIQINLERWYIDDGENTGGTPKSFSLTLNPYMYAVINLSSALFNNVGDVVRLLNSDKYEKDSMEYGKITQGKSIARTSFFEDSYCEQEPSKNAANFSCLSELKLPISPQPPHSTDKLTQKTTELVKTSVIQPVRQMTANIGSSGIPSSLQEGEILGVQVSTTSHTSPSLYLSFVSFSYSLLTIVSVFIKMRNA
ncbi:MAG: lamin tail domain-containing protein [bacterium]